MTMEEMVARGIYVQSGVDETDGEPLYVFNIELAKEEFPEIYWAYQNSIAKAVLEAIDEGYLELDIDPNTLETHLIVTPKGDAL